MQIVDREAHEILAALRSREVTCEALMAATLQRIMAVNGNVNAIVSLRDEQELLQQARQADSEPARGVLHGMPIAVKDLARVAGLPFSGGSPITAGTIPDQDDAMVAHLRAAGAIFIGKTNVPEFGLGSHSYNPVFGVTRNPYDLSRSAGGSSGGAAAALATGMVALADGSDMMGSLRNPAAFCNVYGFRPGWGVVPREPGSETFLQQLSTLGPMARSPKDLALLMQLIAQPNARVPHNAPLQDWQLCVSDNLSGLKVGWLGDWGGALPMQPGILALCEDALTLMAKLGAGVDTLLPPMASGELWDSWVTLRHWAVAAEYAPLFSDPEARSRMKPEAIWEIENGLRLSAMDISRAGSARSRWYDTLSGLFETYDVLALPSAQVWPFPAEWDWPRKIEGTPMDSYHRWMEIVVPVSLAGVPCVNVPIGFGAAGLPMGMQLFAAKGRDLDLLNWAQTWHQHTKWPDQKPSHIHQG